MVETLLEKTCTIAIMPNQFNQVASAAAKDEDLSGKSPLVERALNETAQA